MPVHPSFFSTYGTGVYRDVSQRFWSKVDVKSAHECWLWMGAKQISRSGTYGRFRVALKDGRQKIAMAHRIAYEMTFGIIPEHESYHGHVVMHTCDNGLCCNPNHMTLGLQKDNVADMYAKGRQNRPHGSALGKRSKLNEEKADSIFNDRRTLRAIASEYGVCVETVRSIKIGKTWRHVTNIPQSYRLVRPV